MIILTFRLNHEIIVNQNDDLQGEGVWQFIVCIILVTHEPITCNYQNSICIHYNQLNWTVGIFFKKNLIKRKNEFNKYKKYIKNVWFSKSQNHPSTKTVATLKL